MWISIEQAHELLKISKKTFYRRLADEYYETTEGEKSKNGKSETLILLESLPAWAQADYYRKRYSTGEKNSLKIDGMASLSKKEMEQAFSLLKIVRELDQVPFGMKKTEHIENICKRENMNRAKLYRLKKAFEKSGIAGLVKRKERSDCGKKRTWDDDAVEYLKNIYIEFDNKYKAYEKLEIQAAVKNWKIGSYSQAVRLLNKEVDSDEALYAYVTGGDLGLKNHAGPCILRDYSDLMPNEYFCGDHMQCDVLVFDSKRKKIIRPWLTAWQDMRTRACVGWYISNQPNSRTIAMAFRHAVLPKSDINPVYGIPQYVYIDNGKDYRSNYLSGHAWKLKKLGIIDFDMETQGVFDRLGIFPQYALPFNPGSKPIERMFRTIHEQFEAELPGYVSGKVDTRDGAKVQQDIDNMRLLTIDEYKARFEQYIVTKYHKNPHRGHGMDNRSPLYVWNKCIEDGFSPVSLTKMTIDIYLLMKKAVKIRRNGVRVNGVLFHHQDMIHYFNKEVDVRYDPDDMREVYVFYNNKFLFTAPAYVYGSMHDDRDTIAARMRANRRALKEIKEKYLRLSGGIEKPSNLKGNSVKIRKTKYDQAAKDIENEEIAEIAPAPKNWKILPPDDEELN